ncbi:hypothetical protein GCM10023191_027720 [Actinoallomurus oryzae]|uniref:Uncharacterized protein n=1 Tax=Actinoallomurus oryzae TaxID=502180 RepID=A0ABP8PVL0_9ACTN
MTGGAVPDVSGTAPPGQGDWFGAVVGAESDVGWSLDGAAGGDDSVGGVVPPELGGVVVPPPGGAWHVTRALGPTWTGPSGVGVAVGVTVVSPGGHVPVTTCLPESDGWIEVGLGEELGLGVDGPPGGGWPWE